MSEIVKKPIDTKSSIEKLREKHQPILDRLGVPKALFYPKMAYKPKGKSELFITFFTNELKKRSDIFTEFVSRDYDPEDEDRSLFLWRFNPHWESEYECTEANEFGNKRYYVPVSELIKVNAEFLTDHAVETQDLFSSAAPPWLSGMDAPLSEMTVKDLAAILLKKPVSEKDWLNKIITDIK